MDEILNYLKENFSLFDQWYLKYLLVATKARKIFKKEREQNIKELKVIDLIEFVKMQKKEEINFLAKNRKIYDGARIIIKPKPRHIVISKMPQGVQRKYMEMSKYYIKKVLDFTISKFLNEFSEKPTSLQISGKSLCI